MKDKTQSYPERHFARAVSAFTCETRSSKHKRMTAAVPSIMGNGSGGLERNIIAGRNVIEKASQVSISVYSDT